MNNLWDDEEDFKDIPDEAKTDANGQPLQSPPVSLPRPMSPPQRQRPIPEPQEEYEVEEIEEIELDEEDFSSVLDDADLRLEQGRLYKMIMKHDLFEGVDVDPKAVHNVQKAIRKFAREQMEIMLGMRKETSIVEHLEIEFPFNSLEIKALKAVASKITQGKSENADNYVPEVKRISEEVENIPKKTSLTPISTSVKKSVPIQKKSQAKSLNTKPQVPVKRSRLETTIEQIAREEGVPRELLEEEFYLAQKKPLGEMSEHEIIERNKQIAARRTSQVRSSSALPMATPEQQEMLAMQRANQVSQGPGMSKILEAVKNMPIKT